MAGEADHDARSGLIRAFRARISPRLPVYRTTSILVREHAPLGAVRPESETLNPVSCPTVAHSAAALCDQRVIHPAVGLRRE